MIYVKSFCRCPQGDGVSHQSHTVEGSAYPHCDTCDLPVSPRGDAVVRDLETLIDNLNRSHEARYRFYRNVLVFLLSLDLLLVAGLFWIDGTPLVYAVAALFLAIAFFTFNQTWRLHRELGHLRLQRLQASPPEEREGWIHRDHRRIKVRDRAGQISRNLERNGRWQGDRH